MGSKPVTSVVSDFMIKSMFLGQKANMVGNFGEPSVLKGHWKGNWDFGGILSAVLSCSQLSCGKGTGKGNLSEYETLLSSTELRQKQSLYFGDSAV